MDELDTIVWAKWNIEKGEVGSDSKTHYIKRSELEKPVAEQKCLCGEPVPADEGIEFGSDGDQGFCEKCAELANEPE